MDVFAPVAERWKKLDDFVEMPATSNTKVRLLWLWCKTNSVFTNCKMLAKMAQNKYFDLEEKIKSPKSIRVKIRVLKSI